VDVCDDHSLSCWRRSGKQDREGPRIKKSPRTALERPKTIALISSTLRCGRLISHFFWNLRDSYVSESRTYLWGTGLQRLHGPSKELEFTLGELGSVALGSGGVVVVRHVDVAVWVVKCGKRWSWKMLCCMKLC
jgi:hypothetical protein